MALDFGWYSPKPKPPTIEDVDSLQSHCHLGLDTGSDFFLFSHLAMFGILRESYASDSFFLFWGCPESHVAFYMGYTLGTEY